MTPSELIQALDHVAIGVSRAADVTDFLVGKLGARPLDSGPGLGFLWWQFAFARGGVVEILEPQGPPGGFLHRFLERQGHGVHHVTFKVNDLAAAADHARSQGYEIVGYMDEFPAWKEAFLHPKQAQGIVVQLAESHPELELNETQHFPFPPLPNPAPEPTDLIAIRLSAHGAERARHLWEATLGGICQDRSNMLEFRWADSPLCIRVEIDSQVNEGPIALDVRPPASVRLPEGPHPVLGIPFRPAH
jgi:methylmalonyl-CoA/ethylmalonyl-CoA epimerase